MTYTYRINKTTKQAEIVNSNGTVVAECPLSKVADLLQVLRHIDNARYVTVSPFKKQRQGK